MLQRFGIQKADIGVGAYLLCAILFFIIPIPSFVLDIMLAINLSIAFVILFNCLFSAVESDLLTFGSEVRVEYVVLDCSFLPTC